MQEESVAKLINTKVGLLAKFIKIPADPEFVRWRIDENGDRNTANLTALFEFKKIDYASIRDRSDPYELSGKTLIGARVLNDFFPEVLRNTVDTVMLESGSVELPGVIQANPNVFVDVSLSPLIHGNVSFIGQGYVLVELYSM